MTEVTVKYASGLNMSVTVRDGLVSKVTTWVTGVPGSTTRITNRKGR